MIGRELLTLVALAGVLLVGVAGVRHLVRGTEERGALRRRSMRERDEGRSRNILNRVDRLVRRTRLGRSIGRRLLMADVDLRILDFVAINIVIFAVGYVVVDRYLSEILAVPIASIGVAACWLQLEVRRRRRLEVFIGQLPDVARLMANSASAGLAIVASLEMVGHELDDPAGTEIGRVAQELRLGQSIERALANLRERAPSREVGVLVSTLIIQQRAGGNTVASLRDMSATLEARKELNREVKTLMAQSVFTGYAVLGMGIFILIMMNRIYPGVLDDMLRSMIGLIALLAGVALYAIGLVLIRTISKVEA